MSKIGYCFEHLEAQNKYHRLKGIVHVFRNIYMKGSRRDKLQISKATAGTAIHSHYITTKTER
jgi:hypothetical protein